ncbi:MAG: TonB family protein [bacterium]|nr:TonB family protein [bacterium]
MQGPTRFGDYLLLKKLSEDPLGETYRAGRIDGRALGEIVLLRIFSIPGIDPVPLVEAMREFGSSQGRIEGPGLTYALDSGEIGGVAYSVYEYSVGWDLATLLSTVNSGYSSLPTDHAVLIAERIAKGLAVLHQGDPELVRPFHGFLAPQTVLLSGEGELRLTGFEAAPRLVEMVRQGNLNGAIRPYLSPEVLAGKSPSSEDDVYSLGAILWELLTGKRLPADAGTNLAATLATATLVDSGEVLPEGLAELLQKSLAAERARTPRGDHWYQQLSEWMSREELKTTHFDLAFFIHEQFRKQIRSADEDIAREREIEVSPQPTQEAVRSPASPEPSSASLAVAAGAPPRQSKRGVLIAVAAVVLVTLGAVAFVVTRLSETAEPASSEAAVTASTREEAQPSPEEPPPETAPSSSIATAMSELERLIDERAKAAGDQLAAEYDEQIQSIEEQIREAEAIEQEAIRNAAETLAAQPPAAAEEAAQDDAGAASAATTSEPAESDPQQAARAEAAPPATATAAEPAAGKPVIVPPRLLSNPSPVYPSEARALERAGTVLALVKVLVNEQGQVLDVDPLLDKPLGYGFDQAALNAARKALFQPATSDGAPIKMWTTLTVQFKR